MVNPRNHLFLSFSINKWKFQFFHRPISFLSPFHLIRKPFVIRIQQSLVPALQFFPCHRFPETLDHLRIQMCIRHLNINLFQSMIIQIDPGIAERLCTMYQNRFRKQFQILIHAFDLINADFLILRKNSVCTSFHPQDQILIFCIFFQ